MSVLAEKAHIEAQNDIDDIVKDIKDKPLLSILKLLRTDYLTDEMKLNYIFTVIEAHAEMNY